MHAMSQAGWGSESRWEGFLNQDSAFKIQSVSSADSDVRFVLRSDQEEVIYRVNSDNIKNMSSQALKKIISDDYLMAETWIPLDPKKVKEAHRTINLVRELVQATENEERKFELDEKPFDQQTEGKEGPAEEDVVDGHNIKNKDWHESLKFLKEEKTQGEKHADELFKIYMHQKQYVLYEDPEQALSEKLSEYFPGLIEIKEEFEKALDSGEFKKNPEFKLLVMRISRQICEEIWGVNWSSNEDFKANQ